MTDFNQFKIPENKLVATHLFPHSWAPDFWSSLDLEELDSYLQQIIDNGFNTVVIVVPWVGFQLNTDPIEYYSPYFQRLSHLIAAIKAKQLQLILRLGYSHDKGPESSPNEFDRQMWVVANPQVRAAWFDYLDKLWDLVKDQAHVLGGFLCWEDFFWLEMCRLEAPQRLEYAASCGYHAYLADNYSLDELSSIYQTEFDDVSQVPLPSYGGLGMREFCQFWDTQLVEEIFVPAKTHFPALTMEVRVDSELEQHTGRYIDHHQTYDLDGDTPLVIIYYSPAWGASNQGGADALKQIYENLYTLLGQVCVYTKKSVFIDQFNFIDNTPGFERNTRIEEAELKDFIEGLSHVFEGTIVGYGLWSFHDVPANVLHNSHFQWDYPCWQLDKAEQHTGWVEIAEGGSIVQTVKTVPGAGVENFIFDFELASCEGEQHSDLDISVVYKQQVLFNSRLETHVDNEWQALQIAPMIYGSGWGLRLHNRGQGIKIRRLSLYQIHQENGMFDKDGQAKNFTLAMSELNHLLAAQMIGQPLFAPSYIGREQVGPQSIKGIYKDGWMMQYALGYLSVPDPKQSSVFIIRAHVPAHWDDYANRLQLHIEGKTYDANKALQPGLNELSFGPIPAREHAVLTYELSADKCYRVDSYAPETCDDNRAVSILIVELALLSIN